MVSAWDLHLQLTKRPIEDVNGRASGEILDDDGHKLALVSNGKGDSARGWDVEGDKVCSTFLNALTTASSNDLSSAGPGSHSLGERYNSLSPVDFRYLPIF
jgi:hypothetical protein